MSNYTLNVRCKDCGAVFRTNGHTSEFYNSFESYVCRDCGKHGFYDDVQRWVSDAVWWKPNTWFSGHWID